MPELKQRGRTLLAERLEDACGEGVEVGILTSAGGGAVTDAGTRALLTEHAVVFLTVSPDSVADRIRGSNRPLLDADDPMERWTAIFEERRHWYEEVASATFDTSRRPMQKIADEIATWRREQR